MAEKKKSEGIDLLSIYGDEDDDMEDMDDGDEEENRRNDAVNDNSLSNSSPQPVIFGTSTPQQSQQGSISSPPPQQQPVPTDMNISRTGRLTIVDYGHDELTLSPEAEDGEIVATGHVMFGAKLQSVNGDLQEKTPPGTVHILTPSTQATPPQSSEQYNTSQSDAMNYAVNETESVEIDEDVKVSEEESKDIDPLDKFLPPPPKEKCSDELQDKIIKFLSLKKTTGRSFNSEVRNRKEYRNPDFLLHAVTYQDIDQIGSCFSKDVFDPHGYDKSDYYDEIEADMKREMERKEQEKKKSQKVEYISGGTQPGTVVPTPKVNIPIPGVSTVASGGLHSGSATADASARDGRQNKKSKWDKVDTDRRNPLPSGGQDSVSSSVGAHAALLSAANAGSGYTAFAQQRRREAEEKRTGDKKFERRS
ncbi:hypothetical protein LguiA_025101 [Lonicera macranthoides]